ncbi:YbaN family protein [uncultured Veillonella sp.]|uniref:YbaN family protein n=1 Tax=uncultured Veillonella sp. TaxID=159268 RepID=UPI0028DC2F89|nr:YbaN family protein [uncultured Veillonella sp.]
MKTTQQYNNIIVRSVFLTIGAISFVLGTIGIVIPLFPTIPFYMLTVFCFARGSERFHKMFLASSLYQMTVGNYKRDKALTLRTKLTILGFLTIIMAIGAYFSQNSPVALILMGLVWIGHVIAFAFFIKTKK